MLTTGVALLVSIALGHPASNAPCPTGPRAALLEQVSVPDREWYVREERPAPPSHPRVEDRAGMLAPYVRSLGYYADTIQNDLGIDVRVVTMLQRAETIDRQANHLFRELEIGADAPNGGVLVLLNPTLAGARIEVSAGLDAVYTDLFVGRVVREQLTPYASYDVTGMAVLDALHALKDRGFEAAIRREIEVGEHVRSRRDFLELERIVASGAGSRAKMPDRPFDEDFKARVEEPRRSRYAPSEDPAQSVEAFLRAMADHAGDPSLELFTEGSQLQRERYPVAEFEELRIWRRAEDSRPFEILEKGDRAVATSSRRVTGFVPVLLHRVEGLWRVDLPETWKNLFFDERGNYTLHNRNTPYAFGLESYGKAPWHDVAPFRWAEKPGALRSALNEWEEAESVVWRVWRGDLLWRNAGLMLDAMREYEAAIAIAPRDPLPLDRLATIAGYYGFADAALKPLLRLGPGWEVELADAYYRLGDHVVAERWAERAVERDPYDLRALGALRFVLEARGRHDDARAMGKRIEAAEADPQKKSEPAALSFIPREPRIDTTETTIAGDGILFDHATFKTKLTNRSRRAVDIEYVIVEARGDGQPVVMGDLRGMWRWPSKGFRLEPGASVEVERTWGFATDTAHTHLRYVFHLGWRGVGERVGQRSTQWVDTMP